MAIWENNAAMYTAKLLTVDYLCANFWRFLNSKNITGMDEPVVSFRHSDMGGIPLECLEVLTTAHKNQIRRVMNLCWLGRNERHAYTIDDLLADLDWNFNPEDVRHMAIQYLEPKVPNKYKKKGK